MSGDKKLVDRELISHLSRLSFEARGFMSGGFSGRHKSPHRGSSVDFSQYRKYVPGDDVKNIDWKVLGRTEKYFVKEFDAETNLRCHFVLDSSASMSFEGKNGTKLDYAKKIIVTLANILVQQGDSVGLQSFDVKVHTDIPPRTSPKHLHAITETLKKIEAKGETELCPLLDQIAGKTRNRALVIICSDFFTSTEELNKVFGHFMFKKHDLALFHLIDDSEQNFEIDHPTRFVDMETGVTTMVEPDLMRRRYLEQFNKYREELQTSAVRNKVDYRYTLLSKDIEEVLSSFLLDRILGKGRK